MLSFYFSAFISISFFLWLHIHFLLSLYPLLFLFSSFILSLFIFPFNALSFNFPFLQWYIFLSFPLCPYFVFSSLLFSLYLFFILYFRALFFFCLSFATLCLPLLLSIVIFLSDIHLLPFRFDSFPGFLSSSVLRPLFSLLFIFFTNPSRSFFPHNLLQGIFFYFSGWFSISFSVFL